MNGTARRSICPVLSTVQSAIRPTQAPPSVGYWTFCSGASVGTVIRENSAKSRSRAASPRSG